MTLPESTEIDAFPALPHPRYSVCTFVTDREQYRQMLGSFQQAGFSGDDCEYLHIDNSARNKLDAYAGIRRFFTACRGDYIILCHQDVRLEFDDRAALDRAIADLDLRDPAWALFGNAGGSRPGCKAVRITDPTFGSDVRIGNLPQRVDSLDENFIVLRRDAGIGVSRDLDGFHLYGTDLCQLAALMGYRSYVVDFHLRHIGGESVNIWSTKKTADAMSSFGEARRKFIEKYRRAFSPRWIQATSTMVHLSGSKLRNLWANQKVVFSLQKRLARRRTGKKD